MTRKHLVMVCLLGFWVGFLARNNILAAQPLPAYAVSVETVMQRLQEHQDLFLVDVREAHQFAQVRIPGSLNIPLFAVNTKAFLKTKAVVLVDEGSRPHQLAAVCDQLMQAGFEAHFLFGGLNAWHTRSAHVHVPPLHGDVFAQKALNRMPPQALSAEQDGKYWLIIDVSASGGTHPQPLPGGELHPPGSPQRGNAQPQARSIPFDPKNPEQFLADFERAVAHAADRSEGFLILLYNQRGEGYEAIERVLQRRDLPPVFFLEGGSHGYTRFVAQQNQIKQGQQQEITATCPSCAR
jgi:rhodanese-related sulfurtransferase